MSEQNNPNTVNLKSDPHSEQGVYANAISVHINQNEVVLDFGYVIPNQSPTTIKLVSRVNMTHGSAESILNVLSNGLLDWRNKQKNSNS